MKKSIGIAVMNFFGSAALIGLLDLLAARFSFAAFRQIISKPGHIAFACVMGLVLAAGAFVLPRHNAQND